MGQFSKNLGFSLIFFGILCSNKAFSNSPELDPIFYEASAEALKSKLIEHQNSLDEWVQGLEKDSLPFICLGETHSNKYREFYSEHFFAKYSIDVLFMEGTQSEIDALVQRSLEGEAEVKFLGAIVNPIIKATFEKNPKTKFIGVELTAEQKKMVTLNRGVMSREGFIAQNVARHFSKDKKHVMLYGSNHCASFDIGLGNKTPAYRHLKKVLPKGSMRSVKLSFHHISEYLTAALSGIYLPEETAVFKNINGLPSFTYNHIWKLKKEFDNFDDLIYAY